MTKREYERRARQERTLLALGFTAAEAESLRRISGTLHRWYELECGDGNEYGSWAIERDDNGDGPPYMVHHHYRHGRGKDTVSRTRIADRERGAIRRLQAIVNARNARITHPDSAVLTSAGNARRIGRITYYLQTDPRGAVLYILRPGDVPDGSTADSCYTRGICVY